MSLPGKIASFIEKLPGAENTRRFYEQLTEKSPAEAKRLAKNEGLLSDVLTLAAFSPLLATTILQNPPYVAWLNRQRISTKVRGKEELIESLARFAATNSSVEANVLLARFRRRELLRIYLRDIRNLAAVVEITEEISHLADAILEYALRLARQELDNRYGSPLETDGKNRARQARFCIVALGKLGSHELNYSSDIDLLFLYSTDGSTSGQGVRGTLTNREYFIKLAELITKIVGAPTGEGAAYRVDLRLRPHGRVGALAISAAEAVNYYANSARSWERQVLIRSRVSAGDADVFQGFFQQVKASVFSIDETVENALSSVRLSKEQINAEKISDKNFNVKLGKGGIREIEFIAQALQLAYGGRDEWLRAPHTLISLSRLADRKHIAETELTELFEAYEFLRRLEHRLQMENGLQTHLVPHEAEKRSLTARRMNYGSLDDFDAAVKKHSANVNRIFERVFGSEKIADKIVAPMLAPLPFDAPLADDIQNSPADLPTQPSSLEILTQISPYYAEMIASNPSLVSDLPSLESAFTEKNYREIFLAAVAPPTDFKSALAILRKMRSRSLLEIVAFDVFGKLTLQESKRRQTELAEASLAAAIVLTKSELEKKFSVSIAEFPFAVLGLGKLGGGGIDYGSDLDLILVYDDEVSLPVENLTHAEFYSRAVEIFVTVLSSLTRDGLLYRVDLRLRPDGKNGATSISKSAFLNYLETRAAMWEWLAYVKLRGAAGDLKLARETEAAAKKIIYANAQKLKAEGSELKTLREESRRIRERLEAEKSGGRKNKEIDIKFGAGGMLDVYFAVRFLQLRDDVPDDADNRSTAFILKKLHENGSLNKEDFQNFFDGYEFLTELDHNLRLTVGRSSKIPLANQTALQTIVNRMKIASIKDLLQQLTLHRLNIRAAFENIMN
ncbi:MAG: hypothetical protein LH614_15470 [Pyrinomonadaceae bacterium]|nr:hypothetical protein [Pyrinomonadaceae bacterium]